MAAPLIALATNIITRNVEGLKFSTPAAIVTRSPTKGIHGETNNNAAPYLLNQSLTRLSRSGLRDGMIRCTPCFPMTYPTEAPRTDAGTNTTKMISEFTLSLSRRAIVGSVGIGSTDEVAAIKNSPSNPYGVMRGNITLLSDHLHSYDCLIS